MPPASDERPLPPYGPFDHLRHNLKTPLTTISGRAQLLARTVRRSAALTDDEQATLLAELAAIEAAVRAMVAVIDAIPSERRNQADDETG